MAKILKRAAAKVVVQVVTFEEVLFRVIRCSECVQYVAVRGPQRRALKHAQHISSHPMKQRTFALQYRVVAD